MCYCFSGFAFRNCEYSKFRNFDSLRKIRVFCKIWIVMCCTDLFVTYLTESCGLETFSLSLEWAFLCQQSDSFPVISMVVSLPKDWSFFCHQECPFPCQWHACVSVNRVTVFLSTEWSFPVISMVVSLPKDWSFSCHQECPFPCQWHACVSINRVTVFLSTEWSFPVNRGTLLILIINLVA